MGAVMDGPELLTMARNKFAKGLWDAHGWGGGDRRCIVGTLRNLSGQGKDEEAVTRKQPAKTDWSKREPFFTAYEEVIFACVSIVNPDFNPVERYMALKRGVHGPNDHVTTYKEAGYSTEHSAILRVLDEAETILVHYNDNECRSVEEMTALMEQATQMVKDHRDAREAEFVGASVNSIIDSAIGVGIDPAKIVVTSAEDGRAAEAEYEALRKENPDLPPIFSFFMGTGISKSKKKNSRIRRRGAIKAANMNAKELVR